jgi:hypothetical protein
LAACLLVLVLGVTPAHAYPEGGSVDPALTECLSCHQGTGNGYHQGPHSDYSTTSKNCALCHAVHPKNYQVKSGEPTFTPGIMLLPKATVKASCEVCHDGTGGAGVYGSIAARGLGSPGAQHRIDVTNVVPGGDAATGGSAVATFSGVAHDLSCDDCHNPHDGGTVNPFISGRQRVPIPLTVVASTSLLKRLPTGATTPTAEYGSDWCGGCHKGRLSGGAANNHPVDSTLVTTTPFRYNRAAILTTNGPTNSTVLSYMGGEQVAMSVTITSNGGNRGFLMPFPRTPQQNGHYPICQQCHDDSRSVGTLSADGLTARATTSVITTLDGGAPTDNPRFQNFPHETQNVRMLVENGDDLCANCHPIAILP